jgi:NADH-quinone oxidoreductase subunit C
MSKLPQVATIYGDWIEKYVDFWNKTVEALQLKFGDAVESVLHPSLHPVDVPVIFVQKSQLVSVLNYLKQDSEFSYDFLIDITATDELPEVPRFHVVYQLQARKNGARLRIKTPVGEGQSVPTAVGLWPAANWAEREVWDMFGIRFEGHPDLRRILMDYRWEGHPLRKDYPLRGYQIFPDSEPPRPELLE